MTDNDNFIELNLSSEESITKILPVIQRVQNSALHLIKENSLLSEKNHNLEKKIAKINQNVKNIIKIKDERINHLKHILKEYKRALEITKRIVAELQGNTTGSSIKLQTSESSPDTNSFQLQKTIKYYEKRIEDQEKYLIKRNEEQLKLKDKKVNELTLQLKSNEKIDHNQLIDTIKQLELSINEQEQLLDHIRHEKSELEFQLKEKDKSISQLSQKTISSEELINVLENEVKTISLKNKELMGKLTVKMDKNDKIIKAKIKKASDEKNKELNQVKITNSNNKAEIQGLKSENKKLKGDLVDQANKQKRLSSSFHKYLQYLDERVFEVKRFNIHKIYQYIFQKTIYEPKFVITPQTIADELGLSASSVYAEVKDLQLKTLIYLEKNDGEFFYHYKISMDESSNE